MKRTSLPLRTLVKRRDFIAVLGGAAAWPLAARAQDGKIGRVGFINPGLTFPITASGYPIFLAELRKLGFAEGRNLVMDVREIGNNVPRAYASANELVAAKADVILVTGSELGLQAAAGQDPRFRSSCSPTISIRSSVATLKACRIPAATSLASTTANRNWP